MVGRLPLYMVLQILTYTQLSGFAHVLRDLLMKWGRGRQRKDPVRHTGSLTCNSVRYLGSDSDGYTKSWLLSDSAGQTRGSGSGDMRLSKSNITGCLIDDPLYG